MTNLQIYLQTERQRETSPALGPKGTIVYKCVAPVCEIPLFCEARQLLVIKFNDTLTLLCSALTALRAVYVTEVQRLLESVNYNSATGSDDISLRLLKTCAHHLAPTVTLLCNESLCMGQVPACFKHASVVPIYKRAIDPSPQTIGLSPFCHHYQRS